MSVWFAIPSKRPPAEARPVLDLWRDRGYLVALFRDAGDEVLDYHLTIRGSYPGYGAAVNRLCREILEIDRAAEWIVTGGDDVEPDLEHSAEEIAAQCFSHFNLYHVKRYLDGLGPDCDGHVGTFGVMQPTGDRWGDEAWSRQRWPDAPAYIDRICGSPWLGREFCRRMYGGRGPLFEGYHHMYVDEELQGVAQKLGVLWQRRELTQKHNHWGRKPGATKADIPDFLQFANSDPEWEKAKALFESRKAAGFPGHEPIP